MSDTPTDDLSDGTEIGGEDCGSVVVYQVWQLDCGTCGDVCTYGEDQATVPDACESCGSKTDR